MLCQCLGSFRGALPTSSEPHIAGTLEPRRTWVPGPFPWLAQRYNCCDPGQRHEPRSPWKAGTVRVGGVWGLNLGLLLFPPSQDIW